MEHKLNWPKVNQLLMNYEIETIVSNTSSYFIDLRRLEIILIDENVNSLVHRIVSAYL